MKLNVLVACEESQAVANELRRLGHNAYSCDIVKCTGGHPEYHICDDVLKVLNGHCNFTTQDGVSHRQKLIWDMVIAFPPCTHLAVSGARHFEQKRLDGRQLEGIKFFKEILNANTDFLAVENPVNIIGTDYIQKWFPEYADLPNCTQYIQPYEYGDKARKKTGLWLRGLPNLAPTNIVEPELVTYTRHNGKTTTFSKNFCSGFTSNERSTVRSKTYHGIAKAMAEQWTKYVENVKG